MENQATEPQSYEDVCKSGYLRKQKSMHRRYFVLRSASERGPARLEYYETEKKFRSKAPVPKKALNLETCFNINKRADSKNKHMIVLYTRGESFAVAADSEEVQSEWYQAMMDLQFKSRTPSDSGSGGESGSYFPGPAFKEVWQVKVWPKGLGQARNLVGIYRLCLTDKTVNFVKLNSDVPAVVLQLMNVRRCGHSENFFFVEVGRSAMTGPGEFWMQVEDSVVAQNMHETLLEAMKALSEEFRQRTKSQSAAAIGGGTTASNPISVPSRRHHPNPPPSQVGFSRRARTETPGAGGGSSTNTSPTFRHGFSRARTASIGGRVEEGRAATGGAGPNSSPSLNGSCSTTPTPMPKTTRAPTPAKIPLSLVRYTPNPVPSPAPSLSSSSGHGSECGMAGAGVVGGAVGVFSRPSQRISVSGSPSDYGSSDEYGSSPDQPAGPSRGLGYSASMKAGSNYIAMGQQGGASRKLQSHTRRVLRRSSSRECEAERRLLSKRASLPPIALDRLNSRRREEEEGEDEDYTVMCRSASRESFTLPRDSGVVAVGGEGRSGGGGGGSVADNGYMSMLPGVTAPSASLSLSLSLSVAVSDSSPKMDDYMAMTPNSSISPPQHIRSLSSEGYMLMSPSSSCSPDQHGMGTLGVVWGGKSSVESRAGSDYMNMSPISVRSACSTPPPDSEQNPQQGTPKTVHSYFSLPRSYKHTLSTHIEGGPGQGRRAVGGASNSRGVGCSNRQEPARGRHLSPSSSSYSSSSASTESLEDKLAAVGQRKGGGFRTADVCSTGGVFQQRRGPGGQKQSQQQQRRNEPIGLFADMSKASTLPRVRENPLPPVPQSPGEYVSIQFRGDAGGRGRGGRQRGLGHGLSLPRTPLGPMHRPDSSLVGFQTLPRSLSAPLTAAASTEYINMDFGLPPSPSPVSLTTFGFPSFSTPTTPPAVALKAQEECPMVPQEAEGAEVIHRAHGVAAPMTPELPSSCGDYTEMAFSSDSASPSLGVNRGPAPAHTSQASAMELSVDFPLAKASANPSQGARVIRADPQGRRRHCSESFLVSSPLPLSSSSSLSLFPEHTQTVPRQLRFEGAAWGSGPSVAARCSSPAPPAAQALSVEQGLNYIDLDLANKESPHPALEAPAAIHPPPPRLFASFLGGGAGGNLGGSGGGCSIGSNLNTYASIDFLKSEELRTHQNTSKDSPECGS